MDIGKIAQKIADCILSNDGSTPQSVHRAIQRDILMADFFLEWDAAAVKVNNLIGYLAGNFPPNIGNQILEMFNVRHPYFGSKIPENALDAFKIGQEVGVMAFKMEQEAKVLAKKKAKEDKLGMSLPEFDAPVDNETAAAILKKMREVSESRKNLGKEISESMFIPSVMPKGLEEQLEQLKLVRNAIKSSGFDTLH